jgi:hypothetical protein
MQVEGYAAQDLDRAERLRNILSTKNGSHELLRTAKDGIAASILRKRFAGAIAPWVGSAA